MSVQGNLQDMSLADLIQHNCQDKKTALLRLDGGELYFKDGAVVHAQLGSTQGENAVYEMLRLDKGKFFLEIGIEPPKISISRSWSSLLFEAARRIDEGESEKSLSTPLPDNLSNILKALSEQLNGYIASVISATDGTMLAQHGLPSDSISAQISLLIKLVETSIIRLDAGNLEDELLTTSDVYLLIRYLPDKEHFLGIMVSRKDGNLGKLRLLARLYVNQIAQAL